ncbi:MAG: DUF1778 domain-containing protein [Mesorhizobium sp.]|nr:MAG: DUF1778 domain-containing protein [Mesorhizobium sp.]TIV97645.1 MAG: DUF1778 domain-containing protein [Mesorhizobium sp.]
MADPADSKTEEESPVTIDTTELLNVSYCDFALIHKLLKDPPGPNAKLRAAIAALPDIL